MSPDTLLRNTHVDTLQAAPQVPSNMLTVHLPLALHARTRARSRIRAEVYSAVPFYSERNYEQNYEKYPSCGRSVRI